MGLSGWITPAGRFIACNAFEHLESISERPELAAAVPNYTDLIERVEENRKGCQALVDAGDHGEWHCYEMAYDDAAGECWQALLKAGFIRVRGDFCEVYFEGRPEAFVDHADKCRALAEQHDLACEFEPMTV